MRNIQFFLALSTLPYFVIAFLSKDEVCKIALSGALETGCSITSSLGGIANVLGCIAAGTFTWGLSCVASISVTAAFAGRCTILKKAQEIGKLFFKVFPRV